MGGPREEVDSLYVFPPGTTWTYDILLGKDRSRGRLRVKKVEAGKVWIEGQSDTPPVSSDWVESHVLYVENGYLFQANMRDGVLQKPRRLYRLGSRKGHSWASDPAEKPGDYVIHHLGLTTVTVPAGRFENVLCLRLVLKASVRDYYFHPGTGLVKLEESMPGEKELEEKFGLHMVQSLVGFAKAP